MRIQPSPVRRTRGSTLVMVLILTSATLLVLASTLDWTTTNMTLSTRNNEYYKTLAIAEAATEKVVSKVAADYQAGGDAQVFANLDAYRDLRPLSSENPIFASYRFNDGQNQANKTFVQFLPPSEFRQLTAQYRGLRGYSSAFRVISNARDTASKFNLTAGVRQDLEVTAIPLFQFAIFYNLDLEINPGPVMTITGPVHGNQNMYLSPGNVLTFSNDVTAAKEIKNSRKPGDPTAAGGGSIVFKEEHDGGVSTLNLPIGTNNSVPAVRSVLDIPSTNESPTSIMGKERFYNKADIIVKVTDTATNVTSGRLNNFGTSIPASQWNTALNTNGGFMTVGTEFFNRRENKTVNAVQINVGKLVTWSASNTVLRPTLGRDVNIIYVDDQRTTLSGSKETGVRMVNGALLPPGGLTVATPEPIYVQGDYNVKNSAAGASSAGSLNTLNTRPAALIGDAVTVLSGAWKDTNSTLALASRIATNTTVNAAFLGGIVETTSGNYSGGVENYPRFLEDWGNKIFTYSGSMVVMFNSVVATGLWRGTGSSINIYNPPDRNWAFDQNFRDPAKLPPGTPTVRTTIRSSWAMIKPNTTTVVNP